MGNCVKGLKISHVLKNLNCSLSTQAANVTTDPGSLLLHQFDFLCFTLMIWLRKVNLLRNIDSGAFSPDRGSHSYSKKLRMPPQDDKKQHPTFDPQGLL